MGGVNKMSDLLLEIQKELKELVPQVLRLEQKINIQLYKIYKIIKDQKLDKSAISIINLNSNEYIKINPHHRSFEQYLEMKNLDKKELENKNKLSEVRQSWEDWFYGDREQYWPWIYNGRYYKNGADVVFDILEKNPRLIDKFIEELNKVIK